ncbi:MAG: DUF192 domain-containing protein [Alphaproteobacteria bacterium]|nr:DUF192 domain-containing protein [Alphaproteobacteria bacterium]
MARRFWAVILAVVWFGSAAAQAPATFGRGELEIQSAGAKHHFNIELAVSQEQWSYGLMFRRTLPPDAGMLFVYEDDHEIQMWMKNTLIPLDMIFIRADGTILRIAERTVPQDLTTIASQGPARAVLEVNGGTASRLGIKPGDRVLYPAFKGS